ncbi:hypothetical protein EVAR_57632_1 [Eumeta japonica]|uniref:Uncharacterized protein n=1 Tax=Eumeta variegata TaxID=151549 RepID=A0A4C1ZS86_EUMVA|nr:hypothetical protein EVAR_57632_1 [Eumeta japonica]
MSEAVMDFRGATWEAIIDRADESSRNLNQFCHQLTKTTALKCPITDRMRFIAYPSANSPPLQEHYAQVEKRVRKFMDTPPSSLPEDLFITPATLHQIVMRLPKKGPRT